MTGSEHVTLRVEAEIATVRLVRPPANLLDSATAAALLEALREAGDDDAVKAIVLSGSGSAFCGGTDLEKIRGGEDPVAFARTIVDTFKLLPRLPKPIVAAVNGDALMGGFGLACACDIVLAADSARLGTVEASMGMWPMIAQVPALHRVPRRALIANVLTGEPWDATRALELGIVNSVVPISDLDAEVARWTALVTRGGSAIASGRRLFYEAADIPYENGLDAALGAFASMFDSQGR
jgi:enoyl-CoA hydratase/carnithine racemase